MADPSPSIVLFLHCGSHGIPGPCEPPRSQGPGLLQGQRGHRERIWRSECCPSPISCFKDRRHSALTALPALKSQALQGCGEWRGAARGLEEDSRKTAASNVDPSQGLAGRPGQGGCLPPSIWALLLQLWHQSLTQPF